ncbi:MAG TPA: hypothetical protein VNT04_10320 [Gaiellaceae bacterium]|nr:hypothetical protein [Gaiellaceae bacterium]
MNLVQDLFTSRTLNKWLPWVAVAVLAAGVIAFAAVKWSNTADEINTPVSNEPAALPKPEPASVKLDPAARSVAAKFIDTAVALDGRNRDIPLTSADRQKLAQAWKITGGTLKADTSYKEWLNGNMAVVPYPAAKHAGMQIEYSHKNAVELVFALVPKKGIKIKPQYFLMDLAKVGAPGHKRWIVTYWAPKSPPQVLIDPSR